MPEIRQIAGDARIRFGDTGIQRLDLTHGHGVPAHRHGRGHLVYPATGVLSVTTDAGTWIAPANRAVWIPAGAEHRHRAYGRTDVRILPLPPSLSARLPVRPAVLAVSALAREALLALTALTGTPRPPAAQHRLRAVAVDELVLAPEQPLRLPEPADPRLRALADRLRRDPSDPATLAELGRQVGASERTLSRLFHQEVGMSFRHWRGHLRIHQALVLLAAGRPVTETAIACGWANPTSLIEAFTAVLGQTPGQYRHPG
jgi:AraC-like DNA-binding protein